MFNLRNDTISRPKVMGYKIGTVYLTRLPFVVLYANQLSISQFKANNLKYLCSIKFT